MASPGNGEPQFAQKRPLEGLPVPQRTQRFSAVAAKCSGGAAGRGGTTTVGGATTGAGASGAGAFRRFPQSWQNLRPSGFSRPQRLQFTTSWPLLPFALVLPYEARTLPDPASYGNKAAGGLAPGRAPQASLPAG